ncbi:HPr(Ser) kinase/phosphatase [Spirochaetia bacterium 38H-sp]|uniref:HPr kinase/phosphorylase n=1 Tax=Rarispira pelagica TaxID=3141764 RepID=A0ABU9U9D4_9SPIR
MKKFTVLELLSLELKEHNDLDLKCIAGRKGLARKIEVPNVNRPGLALSGFFESFAYNRIQIFGRGEHAYLKKLEKEKKSENIKKIFTFDIPCAIFTHNLMPTKDFLDAAEEAGCAVLQTSLPSANFTARILRVLNDIFAAREVVHGVLIEVFGIGVLLTGESGVGKSETALELIERGHRLVADDAVEIRCVGGNYLMGMGANKMLGHHMEIRGLGIINITHLFGVGSIRDEKRIELVVNLEIWDSNKQYDRLGAQKKTKEILGVRLPCVDIPIKPGRNIPILIETAAMNERLKQLGVHSSREFNEQVMRWLESENVRNIYFHNNSI